MFCHVDVSDDARQNTAFKRVVLTLAPLQYTVMDLKPRQDIGTETHADYQQITIVVEGNGMARIGTREASLGPGSVVPIPGGAVHNIINTSSTERLKLVVVYTPPKFPVGGVYETKEAAEAAPKFEVAD